MKLIRLVQAGVVMVLGGATGFGVCAGCNAVSERETAKVVAAAPSTAPRNVAVPAPVVVNANAIVTAPTVAPLVKPSTTSSTKAAGEQTPSAVSVKRFVVGTGVQDREPLVTSDALSSDGRPIYAFAELANDGGSENVRITFERKGQSEKVGDVSLPVPANVSRHRTWAFTRYIRAAGVWEAVLWSESGKELSRTSFEVS
jgi:hypothetical protein